MKFPEFDPELRNPYIFKGLVEDIAERELESGSFDVDPKSKALGSLCLSLVEGTPVTSPLRYTINEYDRGGRKSILSTVHDIALYAFDRDRATEIQKELHLQTIRSLRNKLDRSFSENWGLIVEEVGLGLFTRYAHPQLLAYPALPHHEQDRDIPGHYDLGVIIKNPDNSIASHHLQVKSGCFGLCDDSQPSEHFENDLGKYRPFVQLVSGCCHFKSRKSPSRTAIAELLVREVDDLASPQEIKLLDNITDALVFKMTTEQLPRGKAAGNSIHFAPEYFEQLH